MYVDASALVAIILHEPEATVFAKAILDAHEPITSPLAVFETALAIRRVRQCEVGAARKAVETLLKETGTKVVDMTRMHAEIALDAFDRFGKGKHPAALNMGDCFGYAVARVARKSILFKGDDFSRTDLANALGD